jgi:hypothetical protein
MIISKGERRIMNKITTKEWRKSKRLLFLNTMFGLMLKYDVFINKIYIDINCCV